MAAVELASAYVSILPSTKGLGREISKQFGQVETAASKTSSSVGEKLKSGLITGAKLAGAAVAGVLGAALAKGWGRLTSIENAQAKLRGLGHDAGSVEKIMANALASVKGTAFGLDAAATTAAGAVAAGIKPGQQLEGVLKSVANSAAASGSSMDEMGAIYNKVSSLGKAQNDVLQQVADRGIPIYQALADQFGVTTDEIFKMATEGKIGFEDFEKAMTSASGTVADEMGKTTTGSLSNLWAALGRFGAELLGGVFPHIAPLFGSLTEKLDVLTEKVGPVASMIGEKLAGGIQSVVSWMQKWWPLLAVVGAGIAGYAVTIGAVRLATGAWAAVQWALNAAMTANPIGLVIAAIAALVAGIVIAYNKFDWFKRIVDAAWAGIKAAAEAVVSWFQAHVVPVLTQAWQAIAAGATWLWQNIIKPAFNGIVTVIRWAITNVILPLFQFYVAYLQNVLFPIFRFLFNNVVKPIFNAIVSIIRWAINNIIIPIFKAYVRYLQTIVFPIFRFLYNNVIKPVFNGIVSVIRWAWNNVIRPIWDALTQFISNRLVPGFRFIRDVAVEAWNQIRANLDRVWAFIRGNVFAPLERAIRHTLPEAFRKGKDAIGRAWDKLRDVAKKPVKFVIETIINKGIIENFNKIATKFGAKGIDKVSLPRGFDTGGWTGPGRKYKPAGVVHADEYVLRKESQRKLSRQYGRGFLDHMNRFGTVPGFAKGGQVGKGSLWDAAQWWIGKGARASRHSWFNGGRRITSGHSRNSYHYRDLAVDLNYGPGGQNATEMAFFDRWIGQFQNQFPGIRTIWRAPGHYNHLHIDTSKGANMGKGGASGGGMSLDFFTKPFSDLIDKIKGGVGDSAFGQLVGAGAKKMVEAPIKWVTDNAHRVADFVEGTIDDVGRFVQNTVAQGRGRVWAAAKGVPWSHLNYIASRESGWNPQAKNPRSTAAGIPQLIADNQRTYGVYPIRSFSVEDQLNAMHRYVMDRYKSWPAASAYWKRNNHYAMGGMVEPTLFDRGGVLNPGVSLVANKTRKPEYILPAKVTESLMRDGASGPQIIIKSLSINANSEDEGRAALRGLYSEMKRLDAGGRYANA